MVSVAKCDTLFFTLEITMVVLTTVVPMGLFYQYQILYCFQTESRLNTQFDNMVVIFPYLEVQKGVKVKNAQTACQMMGLPLGYWSPSQATWYPVCHHWQWHPVVSLVPLG